MPNRKDIKKKARPLSQREPFGSGRIFLACSCDLKITRFQERTSQKNAFIF